MKASIISFLLAVAAVASVPSLLAQQVTKETLRQTFNEGVLAYDTQNYGVALEKFKQVQPYAPNDIRLRNYIAKSQMYLREGRANPNTLEAELRRLIVPAVEFENANLQTVFDFLSQKATELSGGQVSLNFVFKGTEEERNASNITFKLTGVPMTDVIRYVGDISRVRFTYETRAVVGTPNRILAEQELQNSQKKADPFARDPFA